jgi:hypothetical protein
MKSIKTSIRSVNTSKSHKLNLILEFDEDCTTAEAIEYVQNALRYYDDRKIGGVYENNLER